MFSLWNVQEWIASVGAALVVVGMVAVLSLFIGYVAIAVWGDESEAEKAGFSKAKPGEKSGTRRAA